MKRYTDSDRWRGEIKEHREGIRRLRLIKSSQRCPLERLKTDCAIHTRQGIIRDRKRAIAEAK